MSLIIRNLLPRKLSLPSPVNKSIGKSRTLEVDVSATAMDTPAWKHLLNERAISITINPNVSLGGAVETANGNSTTLALNNRMRTRSDYSPARFFTETAEDIYVDYALGDDTEGNGLTAATAYATVPRAILDLPNGWVAAVTINIAAGTITGNHRWGVNVLPGQRASSGTGTLTIGGEAATAVETLVTGSAGTLVSGKKSKVNFDYGAFTTTVTAGSHYIKSASTASVTAGSPILASTTPTLVVVSSTTTALVAPTLYTWTTIFSGTVFIESQQNPGAASHFLTIGSIRFVGAVEARFAALRNCRFDVGPTFTDCTRVNCTLISGTNSSTGTCYLNSETTSLYVAGSLALSGYMSALQYVVFAGAPSAAAKFCVGGTSATVTTATDTGFVRLFAHNDFEGTGDAIRLIGSRLHSVGSTAAATFVVTGRPLLMYAGSVVWGAAGWTWTGTGGLPALLSESSTLLSATGFAVTNSVAAGEDIVVGAEAVAAVTDRNITDDVQLCRYT